MMRVLEATRTMLAILGVLAIGYWLGSSRSVKAAGDTPFFEMTKVEASSALLVYQPATRSVYVYQGATSGSSSVQCSFKYVLGNRPEEPIQRISCPVPSLH